MFSSAAAARISCLVNREREEGHRLEENTVIEFGASMMICFESRRTLKRRDALPLENSDCSQGKDAVLVTIRVGVRHNAIAARFATEVRSWIIEGQK